MPKSVPTYEWECVENAYDTDRLPVPGGWLYRTWTLDGDRQPVTIKAMVFVPTPATPPEQEAE